MCSSLNDFLTITVSNLNIAAIEYSNLNIQNTYPILATVNSYDKSPSIERMNRLCNSTFSLSK